MGAGTAITAVSHGEKSVLTTVITYRCTTVVMFLRLALTLLIRHSLSVSTCTDATAIFQFGYFASKYFLVSYLMCSGAYVNALVSKCLM